MTWIFLAATLSVALVTPAARAAAALKTEMFTYDSGVAFVGRVQLRAGVFEANPSVPQKACVIYLEGLADSIANHAPLFTALSNAGYRVIAFDYMGQGGSQGSMNHTRVKSAWLAGLDIQEQAKSVWSHYGCDASRKFVIGWSTGGLAAYRMAAEGWADAVVSIAPGIHPNLFVGEAATHPSKMIFFEQVITERTLTRNTFSGVANPHVDPINPISPAVVPMFAKNLLATAFLSRDWLIPLKVKGLVFLSGLEDTYVDRAATERTLARQASHFSVVEYDGALHEIDNELPEVANDMTARTISFFDRAL